MTLRVLLVLALMLAASGARAGLISAEEAASAQARERLQALLERPEAALQYEKMGITSHEARRRVAAMSDEEVRSLAGRLETLPAGGEVSQPEVLMWLILILLVILAA